jgi:hypothetical protein
MRGESIEATSEELDAILGAWLRAGAHEQARQRSELLARYPQFQDKLREFFADFDRVESLTSPLREVAGSAQVKFGAQVDGKETTSKPRP